MKKIIFLTLFSVMFAGSAYGGLVLHTPMDTNATDVVGGAAVTVLPAGTNVFGTPAVIGAGAIQIDGSNPGVQYDVADITTGAFSVSAWVTADSTNNYGRIFTAGNSTDITALHIFGSGPSDYGDVGSLNVTIGFVTENRHNIPDALSGAGFKHIVVTYDATGGLKIYVNGALTTPGINDGAFPTIEDCAVGVGVYEAGLNEYNGSIDDVQLYDSVIDQTAVTALYEAGVPPTIDTQPAPQNVTVGGSATFSVTATNPIEGGPTGLGYAWHREDTAPAVLGTASSYTDNDVQLADEDDYYCVVTINSNSQTVETNHVALNATPLPPFVLDLPMDSDPNDYAEPINPWTANPSGTPVIGTPAQEGAGALQTNSTDQPGVDYDLAITTGAISASAWVTANDVYNYGRIVQAGTEADIYTFSMTGGGPTYGSDAQALVCLVNIGGTEYRVDTEDILTGAGFRHVVATYDSATGLNVYVDGALVGTNTTMGAVALPATDKCGVGAGPYENITHGFGSVYNGSIDTVKVCNYGLNADQALYLYQGFVCTDQPDYDITGDCKVNLDDFGAIAGEWLEDGTDDYPEL